LNSAVERKKKKEKKDITIETVESELLVMYIAIQSSNFVNLGKRNQIKFSSGVLLKN
jgi:hypothetical protein